MKNDASKDLLLKYEQGICSLEEIREVEDWYNEITKENVGTPFLKNIFIQEMAMAEQIWPSRKPRKSKITTLYRKYKPYAAAAAIFFGLSIGIYLMISGRNDTTFGGDADPGTNKAIITLTDGSKINVTDAKDGEISAKSGLQITKTRNGQITFRFLGNKAPESSAKNLLNTIETPNGGEYMVCLPDGSKVWLNAASTLRFPTTFAYASKREVQLSGEAYFQIQKDKAHPFVVSSAKQKVQVLGTHFAVSSYPDEQTTRTTLLEGSVMVSPDGQGKSPSYLIPNQEAVNTGSSIVIRNVDPENAIAWHMGRFSFNEEPLENIMKKISRWYGVTVVYQNNSVRYKTFGGSVSRYSKVSEVLCLLELTKKVRFTIKGKEITVMD